MTKHLLRHAREEGGLRSAPRAALDAWAALWAWHDAGEHCLRLTDESEDALIARPLPPDLPLATAPCRPATAIQMPERSLYIVAARIASGTMIPVKTPDVISYPGPVLVYCIPPCGEVAAMASGYVNLSDQSRPADLRLGAGHVFGPAGKVPLSDGDLSRDDYLLTLAILTLYRP